MGMQAGETGREMNGLCGTVLRSTAAGLWEVQLDDNELGSTVHASLANMQPLAVSWAERARSAYVWASAMNELLWQCSDDEWQAEKSDYVARWGQEAFDEDDYAHYRGGLPSKLLHERKALAYNDEELQPAIKRREHLFCSVFECAGLDGDAFLESARILMMLGVPTFKSYEIIASDYLLVDDSEWLHWFATACDSFVAWTDAHAGNDPPTRMINFADPMSPPTETSTSMLTKPVLPAFGDGIFLWRVKFCVAL